MIKRSGIIGIALAVCVGPAASQQQDNPIPSSGGAIKYADPVDVSETPHAIHAGWRGEKTCELLQDNEQMRAYRCAFPPGVGHERHFHPPHFGYVLEGGVMQITDNDGTRDQATLAGTTWWSDGVEWHEAVNIGETTTIYVIVESKLKQQGKRK